MKIREIYDSKIAEFLGYNITLYPFILYVGTPDPDVRVHEWTHINQIKRVGVLWFYITYFIEYLIKLTVYRNHYEAYRHISYEVQAYANQDDFSFWYEKYSKAADKSYVVASDFEIFLKNYPGGFREYDKSYDQTR